MFCTVYRSPRLNRIPLLFVIWIEKGETIKIFEIYFFFEFLLTVTEKRKKLSFQLSSNSSVNRKNTEVKKDHGISLID